MSNHSVDMISGLLMKLVRYVQLILAKMHAKAKQKKRRIYGNESDVFKDLLDGIEVGSDDTKKRDHKFIIDRDSVGPIFTNYIH